MKLNSSQVCLAVIGAILYSSLSPLSAQARPEPRFSDSARPLYYFFRRNDRPELYRRAASTWLCHVQNPSQWDVFRVLPRTDPRIQVVQNDSFKSGLELTGECRWPDGLYRIGDRPEVYYLYASESSACWVRTSEGVDQRGGWKSIRIVDAPSKTLFTGRKYKDKC
jgi:hypothetical protein